MDAVLQIQFVLFNVNNIPIQFCRLMILLRSGLQLPGNIALLVAVCENLYKVLHTTHIYNACGRKMSMCVIVGAWLFTLGWCMGFWLFELEDYENACMDNFDQVLSTFSVATNVLCAFCYVAMFVVQLITVVFTITRYITLKQFFKAANSDSALPKLQVMADMLTFQTQKEETFTTDLKLLIINKIISLLGKDSEQVAERLIEKKTSSVALVTLNQSNKIYKGSSRTYSTNVLLSIEQFIYKEQTLCAFTFLKHLSDFLESITSERYCQENVELLNLLSFTKSIEGIVLETQSSYLVYKKTMKGAIWLLGLVCFLVGFNIPFSYVVFSSVIRNGLVTIKEFEGLAAIQYYCPIFIGIYLFIRFW